MKMQQHTTLWITSIVFITLLVQGYDSKNIYVLPGESTCEDSNQDENFKNREEILKAIVACIYANKEELKDLFEKLLILKPLLHIICELDSDLPELAEVICPEILHLIHELLDKRQENVKFNTTDNDLQCKSYCNELERSNSSNRINRQINEIKLVHDFQKYKDLKLNQEYSEEAIIEDKKNKESINLFSNSLETHELMSGSQDSPIYIRKNIDGKSIFNTIDAERNLHNNEKTARCKAQNNDPHTSSILGLVKILRQSNPRCNQSAENVNSSTGNTDIRPSEDKTQNNDIKINVQQNKPEIATATDITERKLEEEKFKGNNTISCKDETKSTGSCTINTISRPKIDSEGPTKRDRTSFDDNSYYTKDEHVTINENFIESDGSSTIKEKYLDRAQEQNNIEDAVQINKGLPTELPNNSTDFIEIPSGTEKAVEFEHNCNENSCSSGNEEIMEMTTNTRKNSTSYEQENNFNTPWLNANYNENTILGSVTKIQDEESLQPIDYSENINILSTKEDKMDNPEQNLSYECFICAEPVYTSSEEKSINEHDHYYQYQMHNPCKPNYLRIKVPCNEIRGSIPIKSDPSVALLDYEKKLPTPDFINSIPHG